MSVNHEVKGTLAKLLATENLIIEHKKVPTASFDVLRRVLTLPVWDKASSVVYDLLVGHEVGHALYTPNKDWTQKLKVPKDYVNVVEDARIEKLMKRKFPGLARTFYNGYKQLNQEDFFSIANEKIDRLSLIDRINLHYKIGAYSQMPFNEEEYVFVKMIDTAESFDDVLNICELIYNYTKNENIQNINIDLPSNIVQQGEGGIDDGTTQVESSGLEIQNQEQCNDQSSVKTENSNDQNSTTENKQSSNNIFGSGPEDKIDEQISETQRSFDEQTANLTNNYCTETYYVERPYFDLEHVVVDYKVLLKYINKVYNAYESSSEGVFDCVDKKFKKYQNQSQKEVNYLVKEFEMKKSADAYQRMSTARTGTLNTSKLHMYKYSEDLFRKVSIVPDGKNHGLIFILDWSGSMTDYLVDTIKQLFNLIWFCKKVQIPFEVYAFTYGWCNRIIDKKYVSPTSTYEEKDGAVQIHRKFSLLNFLSSRSNTKELNQSILNLWRLACREDSHFSWGASYHNPCGLSLSGTPLNESIIALHQIIPDFKRSNNLQKINVVILTDGESAHLQYHLNLQTRYNSTVEKMGLNYISNINALRDRKIGHVYRNFDLSSFDSNITSILLENLKDNFPEVNLIGFRILSGSNFYYVCKAFTSCNDKTHEEVMKVWKKQKSYEINGMGYDALYLISSNDMSVDAVMNVSDDATTTEIGRAFRTMLKKKTTNKKLLSSFASLVS